MSSAEHGKEVDQAMLLARMIRRSDPDRINAFTPERADEFLAEQDALKDRTFVNVLNDQVQPLAGE